MLDCIQLLGNEESMLDCLILLGLEGLFFSYLKLFGDGCSL
jgi:hypothetical protein